MRRLFLTSVVLLISAIVYPSGIDPISKTDPEQSLIRLKHEVFDNLSKNLLPFWSTYMVDNTKGGFYGRMDARNHIFPDDDKGGILNARILWTFSSAYRILKDTTCLRMATRSKDYIMKHFIDRKYGGAFRSVKSDGSLSDMRKQTYTQSFFIYGLTEYYRATGDKEALNEAIDIFNLLEKYTLDKHSGGYFEVFDRNWNRCNDLLIGEKNSKDEKTMNTHLHLMEAYGNLYRVWPDKKVESRMKELVETFLDKIIDQKTFHLICFMDKNWGRTSATDSYGHDMEASWLLNDVAELSGDTALLSRVRKVSLKIVEAAVEGIQSDGSIIYERNRSDGTINTERSWWAQAETIVGFLNAYKLTNNIKYLEYSTNCWNYTKNHIVDNNGGGWFSSVSATGMVEMTDKAGFWVCPYHNSRMCMEIIRRIPDLKLWYDRPAGNVWEAALPIGNGRIAGMVFGNTEKEVIKLNESSVWSGSPNRNDNPDALRALPEIRKLIFEGKFLEASKMAGENIQTKKSNGMMFQPVGNLVIYFPGHDSSRVRDYYRELDIDKAIAKVSYTSEGIRFQRETFTSVPAQVLVVHLTADKPSSLSLKVGINSPHQGTTILENGQDELILNGKTSDHEGVKGMIDFASIVKVKTLGGSLTMEEGLIKITGADEVNIYVSIASSFVNYNDISGDANQRARNYLNSVIDNPYNSILNDHVTEYRKYFNRVKLDLGETDSVKNPTDIRLRDFSKGNDPSFAALYFQYNRYLLISCSQPGGQPANLQGIWNDAMNPAWDSKYTININTEMNYWPAEETNLEEMHEPLIEMIKDLSVTGKETAHVMYGARGWVAHHNTDIWRITGPVDDINYAMWPMGGAWLCQHLWEKYLYSGNKDYLKTIYPVLKEACQFYLDFLIEEPVHKWLVVSPSMSPENIPNLPGMKDGKSIAAGVTMDNEILFDLFTNTIHAAEAMNTDKELIDKIRETRRRLPPMQIGKYGQLQEWMVDVDNPADQHRHVSHLFGLYPGKQISPYSTPELFDAARTSLIYRGDGGTGWSMAWKVNFWARFLDGNHALKMITNQLSPSKTNGSTMAGGGTYPNLFDAHPPFQIDGNFGCTAGISEMLMQSHDGTLHLLPALPDNWNHGSVSGLRARGGFQIVSLEWDRGLITKVVIKSTIGGNCRLRVPNKLIAFDSMQIIPAVGPNPNTFYNVDRVSDPIISENAKLNKSNIPETIVYDLQTEPMKTYTLIIGSR